MEALSVFLSKIFVGFITVSFVLVMGILVLMLILTAISGKPLSEVESGKDIVQALRECASDNPRRGTVRRHRFEQSVLSGTGSMSGKIPNLTNFASAAIRKAEQDMLYEDEHHDANDTKFTADAPAAGYEFGGRQVVDEFAVLRHRNAEHERHLEERIQGH